MHLEEMLSKSLHAPGVEAISSEDENSKRANQQVLRNSTPPGNDKLVIRDTLSGRERR